MKRAGFSEKIKIINQIIDLMAENKTYRQIIHQLTAETGKHATQIHRYYHSALKELQICKNIKVEDARNKRIDGLEKDLQEAYANYKATNSARWFELYIQIKAKLDDYYPNGLKPDAATQDLNITIKYDEA